MRRVLRVPNAHVGRGARAPGAVPHAGIQGVGESVPLVLTDELREDNELSMDDLSMDDMRNYCNYASTPAEPLFYELNGVL